MSNCSMRDTFFDRIYELAKKDDNIVIVAADMGAPSLDKFRRDFKTRYFNVGIAEQNAILLATGLALAGKKPIAYAITQFITLRCYEQIRIYPCGMNLPISIVGVGAGACYYESGPTHHIIEDLTVMRALPNIKILSASDQHCAYEFAKMAVDGMGPKFIRLDREIICDIHKDTKDFSLGYKVVSPIKKIVVIATGNMVKLAMDINKRLNTIGIVDIFTIPINEKSFIEDIKDANQIITLEEHALSGGLGSYVLEILNDNGMALPVKRFGMDTSKGYNKCYNYGGREAIRKEFGIDFDTIYNFITDMENIGETND